MTPEELEGCVLEQQRLINSIMESLSTLADAVSKNSGAISETADCMMMLHKRVKSLSDANN